MTWNFAVSGLDFSGRAGGGGRGAVGAGIANAAVGVAGRSGFEWVAYGFAARDGRWARRPWWWRGGGGGFGGRGNAEAETGNYRVVLDVGGTKIVQVLRVVRVEPGQVSVR